MWWKRAFIVLFSVNLLIVAGGVALWESFPRVNSSQSPPATGQGSAAHEASIQVDIGQDAVNTYLQYAIVDDPELAHVLDTAHVTFATQWSCSMGVKILGEVVPIDLVLNPIIQGGNLDMQVVSANIGVLPVPNGLLFSVLGHVKFPSWIQADGSQSQLRLNFSQRPARPFGVQILGYSPVSQTLALQLTLSPSMMLHPSP